ncbi:hypothetical protein OG402_41260 [Streptomyces anulatus]|uniref:hypothetical protein n=1 Tax=Streptomyces anulatus TaxID=1892 RepID=UPI002252A8C7|nr:hypothetical protein [Streptomyces anulatus]MCX4606859.1 hypothetical protein [Streptomyces anulatus]
MTNPQLTAAIFLSCSIEDEQRRFVQEAERLAERVRRGRRSEQDHVIRVAKV